MCLEAFTLTFPFGVAMGGVAMSVPMLTLAHILVADITETVGAVFEGIASKGVGNAVGTRMRKVNEGVGSNGTNELNVLVVGATPSFSILLSRMIAFFPGNDDLSCSCA